MSVKRICEVILKDEKAILPVSTMMHGAHGIEDIVLSMPAIVGKMELRHKSDRIK